MYLFQKLNNAESNVSQINARPRLWISIWWFYSQIFYLFYFIYLFSILFTDHFSDFETMLLNMNDITIHHRNIQTLMIELFKIKYDLAPPIMDSILNRRTICYNFRNLQVSVGKKENCVLWFRNNKLPRTPIMGNFAGRV